MKEGKYTKTLAKIWVEAIIRIRDIQGNLFLLYASRLFEVVKRHLPSVHGYADDTQLYVSFRPDSFAAQDQAIKAIILRTANESGRNDTYN